MPGLKERGPGPITLKLGRNHEHDHTISLSSLQGPGAMTSPKDPPASVCTMPSPLIHTLSEQGAGFALTPASHQLGYHISLNPLIPVLCKATGTSTAPASNPRHGQSQISPWPSLAPPVRSTFRNEQLRGLDVPHLRHTVGLKAGAMSERGTMAPELPASRA